MARRSEVLDALQGVGSGFSKMGAMMMERERFDTQKALDEEEAERKRALAPSQLEASQAAASQAKTLASEALVTAGKREAADAANQAMMAQNEADGWKVDPEDQGNIGTWKAELNVLNRMRARENKPAMSAAEYVMTKNEEKRGRTEAAAKEKRAGEAHASDLATAGMQRKLLGAQAQKAEHEATKPPKASELPVDVRSEVQALSGKTAGKKAIANQLESDLVQMRKAMGLDKDGKPIPGATPNEDLAYSYGQSMLKTMNSKEGADAVGVDEAKRAAGLLEFNVADVKAGLGMKPGKFHGRDIPGFMKQVESNINGIRGAVTSNQNEVDRLMGRNPAGPSAPAAGGLNANDPKVKAAFAAGYSEDEIRAYLGGKK